jgi:hypothetical protein
MYLVEVKTPSESKAKWDYYKVLRRIPAEEAAQPLNESKCSMRLPGVRGCTCRSPPAQIDAARAHLSDRRRALIQEAEKLRSREPASPEGYRTKRKRAPRKA